MRNVLVTGTTGYIGGRLIPRLIERGDTAVRVLVRGHEPILGRPWEGMVDVAVGDAIEEGQPLCTVEAMKMENILRAERKGVVSKINAEPGQSLAVDEIIMEFE